jgi:hypothetical protein
MAMEVNGAAILAALARTPGAFAIGESQVNALAVAMLLGRLKDKTVGLEQVRSIARTIGAHDFRLALDHLPPKEAAALSKRLDAKNPELKLAPESWHREHIWTLADGAIEPVPMAPKQAAGGKGSVARPRTAKTGEVMNSKALKPKAAGGGAKVRKNAASKRIGPV